MASAEIRSETRTAPAGICIYCSKTAQTTKLTEEHVVPFALGGRLILPSASCEEHTKITSAIERRVLRGFMHKTRLAGKFPTRHPEERPATVPLDIKRRGSSGFVQAEIALSEAIGMLFLPELERATCLSGNPPAKGVNLIGVQVIGFGKPVEDVAKALKAKALQSTSNVEVHDFVRMLAKIGYSYAVSAIGPYPLSEVPVLPLILGTADDGSTWVGSADYQLDIERKQPLHALGLVEHSGLCGDRPAKILVARVKLFAASGATGYEIVVRQSH